MLAFSSEEKVKPIVKGTSVWNFNAKKFSASKDKKAESEKLVRLYSGLNSRECSQLMDAKAKDGKTKEQVIHEILENVISHCNMTTPHHVRGGGDFIKQCSEDENIKTI